MKLIPVFISCLAVLLTSCIKTFYVEASVERAGATLNFYDSDGTAKKKIKPCIWDIDIIEETSKKSVLRLTAEDRCSSLSNINIGEARKDFATTGSAHNLKVGNMYHAEVSADEGVGKSDPWKQR